VQLPPLSRYTCSKGELRPLSIGLIALLDDIAAIAKVAAASLDDVAAQSAKAGVKAAGVVIDDAAVTPRYVLGFPAERELPIVGKIAAGSLIKTDFILSAEIMVITLAAVAAGSILVRALVLALVGIGMTVAVYGVVALIVKADDVGVALAKNEGGSVVGGMSRALGRALVLGTPGFLTFLGAAGTVAMIWVGGGIIVHGLEAYSVHSVSQAISSAAEAAVHVLPSSAGPVRWTVIALLSGIVGLLVGAVSIPIVGFVIAPAWKLVKGILRKRQGPV